mmetsp:Transcript_14528/g.16058  ORF Transcript_14528/g.16058 Transcript_14528/m.16058 type:complete len:90 (-) Transcript_14528:96-365(-)
MIIIFIVYDGTRKAPKLLLRAPILQFVSGIFDWAIMILGFKDQVVPYEPSNGSQMEIKLSVVEKMKKLEFGIVHPGNASKSSVAAKAGF